MIIIIKFSMVRYVPVVPSRESSRCPAIILAVSRTANVMGRIIKLIDSIITMNGIRGAGVP